MNAPFRATRLGLILALPALVLASCAYPPGGYYPPPGGPGPGYSPPPPSYPPGPAQNTQGGQIFPGQTLTGALAPGDPQLNSGEWYDQYTLYANAGQTYDFDMSSGQFDTYLIVREPGGQQFDNDDANGTDSSLSVTATVSGPMVIQATSYAPGQGGSYQLSAHQGYGGPGPMPPPPPPPPPVSNSGGGPLTSGQTRSGVLGPGDPQLNSGEWYDEYTVNVAAGTTVNVTMSSGAFDTYLIARSPNGQQVDNDDASGTDSALSIHSPASGLVRIQATSYAPGQGGQYTIRADVSGGYIPPPPPPYGGNTGGGWINLGQTVSGSLSPGDPQLNSGEYYDTYQVNVSGGQTVRFRCNSQQFDTYLIVIDPQQQQRENDDMTGTNAGLDLYMPASGTAQIHVTSYQAGETGGYTLQVY